MKKILLCLVFSITVLSDALAQLEGQAKLDSIVRELPKYNDDTNKVRILNTISFEYMNIDPDYGIRKGTDALNLAEKLQYQIGIARAYNNLGSNYCVKSDFPGALSYYFRSLKIYENLNDSAHIAQILGNIGTVYLQENDYSKAFEYFSKALPINEKCGDRNVIASNLTYIASYYSIQKDYHTAYSYYQRALNIYKEIDGIDGEANIFQNIGEDYLNQKDYSKALIYLFKSANLYELLGNEIDLPKDYDLIGQTYLLISKLPTQLYVEDSLIPKGKADNLKKAKEYLTKCYTIAEKNNELSVVVECLKGLSEVYLLNGDCKEAINYLNTYCIIHDSISSPDNYIKISKLEAEREKELRDRIELLESSKRRNRTITIVAAFAIMFIIILIIFRNNKLLGKEKLRSERLLHNILPVEVARELGERGKTEAKYYDNVTVLLSDFVGFTKLADKLSPQQLVSELDICFKGFDEIISKYNIEKIKTIGDAYLAVSGLPMLNQNHAADMVKAAIEIRNFMLERRKQIGGMTFEIRIGIHSGSVVAGVVGIKKFAYDIWGDTVNTAARMEQNSQPGQINISQATYEIIKDQFDCTYRGEIEAKNKGLLKMYFVS